jgi:hypothetical protein
MDAQPAKPSDIGERLVGRSPAGEGIAHNPDLVAQGVKALQQVAHRAEKAADRGPEEGDDAHRLGLAGQNQRSRT